MDLKLPLWLIRKTFKKHSHTKQRREIHTCNSVVIGLIKILLWNSQTANSLSNKKKKKTKGELDF